MIQSAVVRVQSGLGLGDRSAQVVAWGSLAIVGVTVAISTRFSVQVQVLGLVAALFAFLASLRWPLLPLLGFAVLIPIEEAVVLGQLGSLSRYAEILFIVAYGLPRLGRLAVTAMPAAGWAYVGWAMFSITWAIDPLVTIQELPILGLLFTMAVLVAAFVVEHPTIVRPVLWAYSLAATVTAAIGILAYLRGDVTADRVAALPGQDPAHYAALLLPALVFAIYELLAGRWILVASVMAMASTAGIVVSGTRGAWVSAAVVVALYLLPRLDPIRRIVAVGIVAILLGLTLQLPGVSALITERTDSALASGGAGRTDIWSVGLLIYASTPINGVGLDNFPVAYTPELIRESGVTTIAPWRPAFRSPHNIIIGTLGELGTIGLALLGLFLLPLLRRRGWGPDASMIQAVLASLCMMALFLDLLNRKEIWLVLGLASGLALLARRDRLAAAREAVPVASDEPSSRPRGLARGDPAGSPAPGPAT